jgi:OFA family oxalate/formate antiporter-like MFS transporter
MNTPLANILVSRAQARDTRPIFYGWVMLFITTLSTMATAPGQSFVVGTFSDAIRHDLDISLSEFSAAYMIATFCASLPLTLVGRISDRRGTRYVMTMVAIAFGLACICIGPATSLTKSISLDNPIRHWVILLVLTIGFFFLRFLGQGALGLVSSHALAMWYERRLGFAEAVRHLGMPLAVALLPFAVLSLIAATNWSTAYAILGICVWVIVLPLVAFAYVNTPEDIDQNIDGDPHPHPHHDQEDQIDIELDAPSIGDAGLSSEPILNLGPQFTLKQALRTRAYWIVTASMVLSAAVGTSFVFHTQPMVADLGLSKPAAAAAVGTLGFVSFIVTIPFGHLIDKVRPRLLLAASGFLLAAACIAFTFASSITSPLVLLHTAFFLLGLSQALLFLLASPIFARFYGRTHHGAIRGSLTTFMVIGTSAGPLVFSFWRDLSGNFNQVFTASAIIAVILAIWAMRLHPPSLPGGTTR